MGRSASKAYLAPRRLRSRRRSDLHVLLQVAGHAPEIALELCHYVRDDVLRKPGTYPRQRLEPLVQDLPGRLPVREQEESGTDDLEGGAGGPTRKFGADR